MQAVEAVLSGQVDSAFAVVRPPGHHAEPTDYMGFCFFNNVAVAAHAALKHPGIHRVLVLDWDVSILAPWCMMQHHPCHKLSQATGKSGTRGRCMSA